MRYVYNKVIKPRVPGSAVVRIIFGTLCAFNFLVILVRLIESIRTDDGEQGGWLILSVLLSVGAFLLLFFGFRAALAASRNVRFRDPTELIQLDPNDPFFSITCTVCATRFDYQKSDLGFRPWFPNGYVECPECQKPLRHDIEKNIYIG